MRRCVVVASAALVGSLLTPSVDAASSRPHRVTLGRLNSFTASTISGVPVHVPGPATYTPGVSSPDIRIEGDGRMTGFVLLQEDATVQDRIAVMTTLSRFCKEPGCESGDDPFFWHGGANSPMDRETKVRTLPAGNYLLYVIADATPVTVTLRLHGLSGTRRMNLTRPADGAITIPPVRTSVEPGKAAYWFGDEVDFSGPSGVAIPLIRFETGKAVSNRREVCYYNGSPNIPDAFAYGPGCPTADAGVAVQETGFADGHEVVDGYFSQVTGRDTWGFGMNYVVTGEVRSADSLFFYVDVDPAEL